MPLLRRFRVEYKIIFKTTQPLIENQAGCKSVSLKQNIHQPNMFFTYSIWKTEEDLNAYRDTDLFIQVWKKIKAHFTHKAQAWSLNTI